MCVLLQQTILLRVGKAGEKLHESDAETSFGSNPAVCEFADEKDLVPAQVIAVVVCSQAEDEGRRTRASVRCKTDGERAWKREAGAPHEDQDCKVDDDEDVLRPGPEDEVEEDVQQDENEVQQDRLREEGRLDGVSHPESRRLKKMGEHAPGTHESGQSRSRPQR